MAQMTHSAVVPFTTAQMYELVNRIEDYPQFLPWCAKTQILSRSEDEIQATVYIAKGVVSKAFTTANRLLPHKRVEMRLLEGPFHYLEGAWHFEEVTSQESKIIFDLAFEFNSKLLTFTLGPVFHQIANSMVQAFTDRAFQVYVPR